MELVEPDAALDGAAAAPDPCEERVGGAFVWS